MSAHQTGGREGAPEGHGRLAGRLQWPDRARPARSGQASSVRPGQLSPVDQLGQARQARPSQTISTQLDHLDPARPVRPSQASSVQPDHLGPARPVRPSQASSVQPGGHGVSGRAATTHRCRLTGVRLYTINALKSDVGITAECTLRNTTAECILYYTYTLASRPHHSARHHIRTV